MQTIKTTKPSQLVKVFQKKTLKLLKVNKDFLGKPVTIKKKHNILNSALLKTLIRK